MIGVAQATASKQKSGNQGSVDKAGPIGWRNWRAEKVGRERNGAFEYALYTDAPVPGEIPTGPYVWLNTLAHGVRARPGHAAAAIVLRAEIHLTDDEYAR